MSLLFVLIPLLVLIFVNVLPKNVGKKILFWYAILLFLAQVIVAIAYYLLTKYGIPCERLVERSLFGRSIDVDGITFIMMFCVGIVSLASLIVARCVIKKEEISNYVNLLVIAATGMSGLVISSDIFSLYVFIEIIAVSSFILISFDRDINALEGTFKYIIMSAAATVIMLTAIAMLFMSAGDTSFAAVKKSFDAHNVFTICAAALFLCGLFIKGGLVPFHAWLPDAYSSAPAPVTIFLAGIVTKMSGIYTIIRLVVSVFGLPAQIQSVILMVGAVSILIGAFAAMGQNDFKRMLAYSSISQMGYIMIGLGAGNSLGLAGAVFHFFNHAIFKSLLFVNVSAVEMRTGTRNIGELKGVQEKMPVTGWTSVVGLLSVSGVPPLSGFWSKLIIVIALVQCGRFGYAVIAILASVVTLAYLLILQRKVFWGNVTEKYAGIKEVCPSVVFVEIMLAGITVLCGLFFPFFYNNFLTYIKELIF